MSMANWKRILRQLRVESDGIIPAATEAHLKQYEANYGRLSNSYKSYCRVFGPGIVGGVFRIAAPGYDGSISTFSPDGLRDAVINGTNYKRSAGDGVERVERGLFFCIDSDRAYYFFDPEDVPYKRPYECAVYRLAFDYSVHRLADSYWQFFIAYCIGNKFAQLFPGSDMELTFVPAAG